MRDFIRDWTKTIKEMPMSSRKEVTQEMTVERALSIAISDGGKETVDAVFFLRQHIAKLEADARRYRWLRDGLEANDVDAYEIAQAGHRGGIDQAIDRAMGEK